MFNEKSYYKSFTKKKKKMKWDISLWLAWLNGNTDGSMFLVGSHPVAGNYAIYWNEQGYCSIHWSSHECNT